METILLFTSGFIIGSIIMALLIFPPWGKDKE